MAMGGLVSRTEAAIARLFTASILSGAVLLLAAPGAQARDFNCDASAFRLQIGSAPAIEPITANRGATDCKQVASQTKANAGGVTAGVLLAQTTLTGSTQVQAQGGLGFLSIATSVLAGLPTPTLTAIDALPAVNVPISPAGQLLGLPSTVEVDIRPAVKSIVTGAVTSPLLELTGSLATANASCVNDQPQLSGTSTAAGLKVLGQALPTDQALAQAVTLYNGQTINPSSLDLSQIVLPQGLSFTDPATGTILQDAVKAALAGMSPITVPASVLGVAIQPSSQQVAGGGLTQQGLHVSLSLVGQNAVDLLVGQARVSVDSVQCLIQTPAGSVAPLDSIPNAALSCSRRRLALIDVIDRGSYVSLVGAADKSLAGTRVSIYSEADHRVVARPIVSKAGLFSARAPLPPRRLRFTNRARYLATDGSDHSLNLKLHRRMIFTTLTSAHGKVTLSGVVSKPFAKHRQLIVIRQRLTCTSQRVVARVRPDRHGRFSVTLKAPKNGDVGVYRSTTIVGFPGGPDFRTYTLPGLVRFAR